MLAINLDLRNKTVLLVGAGAVGQRKLQKIIRAGAVIRVIEPAPDACLLERAEKGAVALYSELVPPHWAGVSLALVATSNSEYNRQVAREARARGIWVNVAENPAEGDFFLPAVLERGDFCLAISTGGRSPALAAVLTERLREIFGPEYGRLLALLARLRPLVLASSLDGEGRKALFRSLAESEPLLRLMMAEPDGQALLACLSGLLPPDLAAAGQLLHIIDEAAHTA